MEQFKSLADDFNDKIGQQLNLISLMSSDANDGNAHRHEIHENQMQLRQLHNVIKLNCSCLISESTNGNRSENGSDPATTQDAHLSSLSKSLNEFMQSLDKLNGFYTSSTALK